MIDEFYIRMDEKEYFNCPICACIGYFDGMHRGHQALIKETIRLSRKYDCDTAMITFEPDPWVTIKGMTTVRHISTMRQRIQKAEEFGIQHVIILSFSRDMSELSPAEFINLIHERLNLKAIVCGFDFHYGYKGLGNSETLHQDADCEVVVVPAVEDEAGKISSTRIDQALLDGNMAEVQSMLGFDYEIDGYVIHGAHIGEGMGYATANIGYDAEYLLPKLGVYAGFVKVENIKYQAMINLGHNPTLNYRKRPSLEAHLMNYDGNLYGKEVSVILKEYVREEKKFASEDELIQQLNHDVKTISEILDQYE